VYEPPDSLLAIQAFAAASALLDVLVVDELLLEVVVLSLVVAVLLEVVALLLDAVLVLAALEAVL